MREQSKFPASAWDGLSKNTQRDSLEHNIPPDGQDWSRITAEVMSVEEYLLATQPSGGATIYQAEASESLDKDVFVAFNSEGILRTATSNDGLVTGLCLFDCGIGDTAQYQKAGEVVRANWSILTGNESLIAGTRYYLQPTGKMAAATPLTGYVVCLGDAVSDDTFHLNIGQRIKL
jgi:hypothetical protein